MIMHVIGELVPSALSSPRASYAEDFCVSICWQYCGMDKHDSGTGSRVLLTFGAILLDLSAP